MNTYKVRILGYQAPQVETFRYWFLSHFPHQHDVKVIHLTKNSSQIGYFQGITLLILFHETDIIEATSFYKESIEHPIIIYHDSLKDKLNLFKGEKYPLHECMKYLEKKFLNAYERIESVSFTKREKEVLELFAQGMSVKEVAYNLQISPYTVATHQRSLYLKTKSHSLQQLTLYASMEYQRGED